MSSRPLGTFRVTWLVSGLALRRLGNRLSGFRRRRPGRGATPRKSAAGKTLLGVLGLLFAVQAVTFSSAALGRAAHIAEQSTVPGVRFVHPLTWSALESLADEGACHGKFSDTVQRARLDEAFELEGGDHRDSEGRAEYRESLKHEFRKHCLRHFRASRVHEIAVLPARGLWYRDAGPFAMPKQLGIFAWLFTLTAVLQTIAGLGRDLADVDARFEWLFAFPVRARSLFLARMLAMALTAPLIWVLVWPFYASALWSAGYGWFAVPLGALAALHVGVLAGALRVLCETTLPRLLSQQNVGRIQAVIGLGGALALVPAFALAYTPGMGWVFQHALALPSFVLYGPATAPLLLGVGGMTAVYGGLATLVSLLGAAFGSVAIAERMVSNGVVAAGGVEPGRRGEVAPRSGGRFGLRGVALKEVRALLRDRQLRTQAFLTPVLAISAQILLNPRLLSSLGSSPRTVAAAAFGTAAFSLLTGAFNGLATEGQALWTLYTAPVKLERLLLAKVHVWVGVAGTFATLVFVGFLVRWPSLILPSLPNVPLIAAGVYLYAVIGLGLGALGTDVLEPEPRRRLRPGATYLFMLLVSLYAYSLYSASWWAKVVELVLSALLAYAIWQKLKDHLPYLLDPTEAPPPNVAVADGVLAALGFFAFQGLFMLLFRAGDASLFQSLTIAFAAAGVMVTASALWFFKQSRVPELWTTLGLVRPTQRGRFFEPFAVLFGVLAGGTAALFGLGYKAVVFNHPYFLHLLGGDSEATAGELAGSARVWLTVLAVVAAPLFEEFIFRGVLYRGFRRSFGAPLAALLSALVFALVHPAASALPVFVMAFLAALVYERFRWLLAPILAHMTYNAVMVGTTLWLR